MVCVPLKLGMSLARAEGQQPVNPRETAMAALEKKNPSLRRKFLRRATATATAAAGTAGAAALGFPAIVKAQGPIVMRWQSTWPQKDIFHEYAGDFVSKVNTMTGGDLKIELLPAGAVVKAFDLIDAVSKGTLDGGHGVCAYWYGKNSAIALWGSGDRARRGAWMPTCCSPGTNTAAARNCWRRSTAA
jgi:hypothetical protein